MRRLDLNIFSWGWSGSAPANWNSGGFAVSQYQTDPDPDSIAYTCNGGPNEAICMWAEIQTTAYTVNNYNDKDGECGEYESTSILFSPNTCNNKPAYYCVAGPCSQIPQFYDTENAPAGGPAEC